MLNCQENKLKRNTAHVCFIEVTFICNANPKTFPTKFHQHKRSNLQSQIILKKHDLVSIKYGWQSNLFNSTNTLQTVTHNSHAGIRKNVRHEHMTHKAMKWCITKVPTRPAMFPCHKTASKNNMHYFVERIFICKIFSVITNKHARNHDAFAL